MELGLYGKHPGWGDFVQAGLPPPLLAPLEIWLDAVLGEARAVLGQDWEQVWDQAGAARPVLRFWLGEELWGQPVCGVMAASHDRVGRRFPLLVLAAGAVVPPPVLDAAQDWYDAAEQHLREQLEARPAGGTPAALLNGLGAPDARDPAAGPAGFWAMGTPQDLPALLADIAATDHRRAVGGRSYWWRAGHAATALVAEHAPQDAGAAQPEAVPVEMGAPHLDLAEMNSSDMGAPNLHKAGTGSRDTDALDARPVGEAEGLMTMAPDAAAELAPAAVAAAGTALDERLAKAHWHMDPAPAPMVAPAGDAPLAAAAGDPGSAAWSGAAWLDPTLPEDPLEDPLDPAGAASVPPMLSPAPRPRGAPPRASQVYAGPGLPDGTVLAWLLRGEAKG